MRKILIAFIAAASIGAMSVATSSKAEAWWGWWLRGAVVGEFVGGESCRRKRNRDTAVLPAFPTTTERTLITDHAAVASGTVTLGCPPR